MLLPSAFWLSGTAWSYCKVYIFIIMYQSIVITSPNLMEAAKQICRVLYCFCSQGQMPDVLHGQTLHCNVKHNRLRGETVVGLSTGYPPQCVAYSRHAKIPAVVRTSCLQMIRVVHVQSPRTWRTSGLPGAINYLLVIYGGKPAHILISDLN